MEIGLLLETGANLCQSLIDLWRFCETATELASVNKLSGMAAETIIEEHGATVRRAPNVVSRMLLFSWGSQFGSSISTNDTPRPRPLNFNGASLFAAFTRECTSLRDSCINIAE